MTAREREAAGARRPSPRGGSSAYSDFFSIVTEHLATALDPRFSESRKVRQTLRAEYPKTEVQLLLLAQWPPDLLAADEALARAVRRALTPERHDAFDEHVASLRDGRRRAERVVRAQAAGQ